MKFIFPKISIDSWIINEMSSIVNHVQRARKIFSEETKINPTEKLFLQRIFSEQAGNFFIALALLMIPSGKQSLYCNCAKFVCLRNTYIFYSIKIFEQRTNLHECCGNTTKISSSLSYKSLMNAMEHSNVKSFYEI